VCRFAKHASNVNMASLESLLFLLSFLKCNQFKNVFCLDFN
jgi:hypothetical protein